MQKTSMLRKAVLVGLLSLTVASPALADTFVNGHSRSDGTYVQPHWRSTPDGNFWNNWSTQGNVNPYTGQWGTRQFPSQSFPTYRSNPFPSSPTWPSSGYRDK
ncbi:MAG: hypothetical protein AB7P18_35200 [Candidatus Binatia bacterium]